MYQEQLTPYRQTGVLIPLLVLFLFLSAKIVGQTKSEIPDRIVLSAIKGTSSKPDTLILNSNTKKAIIKGENSAFFKVNSFDKKIENSTESGLVITFTPPSSRIGIVTASMKLGKFDIDLVGLSTNGLEGENEAPLHDIMVALGYQLDLGWESLANHIRPELQGDEIAASLFRKAGEGNVEMIPLARYSPDFPVNFGYYLNTDDGPRHYQSGILSTAGDYPEHQIIYPKISSGSSSFDPGENSFGIYSVSPSHTLYTEDHWNMLFYPEHAAHAVRIYPIQRGNQEVTEYMICMEEASNGDYNDYVFILKNVKHLSDTEQFTSLFNGKDFTGWYKWIEGKGKNNDPDNIFTVNDQGIIHDTGKDLGYIMTDKVYKNYHFSLEFKWGEKRWPPRLDQKRDSGICYHIPEDEPDHIWPQSVECQIQEGDVGDFWLLGYSTIQVNGKQNIPLQWSNVKKTSDNEHPNGEWNQVEVISFNGKCIHIVNGQVVNYGENSSLSRGKILIQSEYAEIYYRNINIREF